MKAFPVLDYQSGTNEFKYKNTGMDLRDYFAAKVLGGYVAGFKPNPLAQDIICERGYCKFENNAEAIAHYSYVLADALIKAREENK